MQFQAIPFPAANKSGESIPARSFVRVDSGQNISVGGSPFRVVNGYKPDGSTDSEYWVTGDGLVPSADNSQFVLQVPTSPVWVKFDADPEGDVCGPVDGEWTASGSGTGFRVLYYDSVSGCGLVIRERTATPTLPEDVGNCACVVGVGVHDPDESPPFYHPSCHRWIPKGVAAVLNEVPGISGLTDDDLVLTRHDTDPHWDSAIFERECPGMSGVTTDYVLILEQEANGWHLYTDVASGSSENCDDTLDWHWKSP